MRGHHHLLLVLVGRRCLSLLVYDRKDLAIPAVCCADPRILGDLRILPIGLSWLELVVGVVVVWLLLTVVARANLVDKVAVEHSLEVLIGWDKFRVLAGCVKTCLCLVEHGKLLLSCDIGQHIMDPWVVGRCQHDSCLRCVHLVNAQWSVIRNATLLAHPVGEEGLVGLLVLKHFVDSVCWRLALDSSELLLVSLMDQRVCEWAVCHRMFVLLLKVWHHILKPCLGSAFGSFLLYLIHLFKVLFCGRVQLVALIESLLCLHWPWLLCFRFWNVIYLKSTSHCRVHHNFTRRLNLLNRVQRNVIQVWGTIQVTLFISHNLLKEVISTSFPLFLFKQQVISRSYLIMFVVLNVCNCLVQIAVWTYSGSDEAVLYLAEKFVNNWNSILTNYDAIQLSGFDLIVPLVSSNLCNCISLGWIRIENFLN